MSSKISKLKIYSQKLLQENPSILKTRNICPIQNIFDDVTTFEELQKVVRIKNYTEEFRFLRFNSSVLGRIDIQNNVSKWQIEDARVIFQKENVSGDTHIDKKRALYYDNKKPIYSLIIFGSNYGKDYKGGIFEFSDKEKIKPTKNQCIFFDAREAYKIHRVKEGVMKCITIKFYKNE